MGLLDGIFSNKRKPLDPEDGGAPGQITLDLNREGVSINGRQFPVPARITDLAEALGAPRVLAYHSDKSMTDFLRVSYGLEKNKVDRVNYVWDKLGLMAYTYDRVTVHCFGVRFKFANYSPDVQPQEFFSGSLLIDGRPWQSVVMDGDHIQKKITLDRLYLSVQINKTDRTNGAASVAGMETQLRAGEKFAFFSGEEEENAASSKSSGFVIDIREDHFMINGERLEVPMHISAFEKALGTPRAKKYRISPEIREFLPNTQGESSKSRLNYLWDDLGLKGCTNDGAVVDRFSVSLVHSGPAPQTQPNEDYKGTLTILGKPWFIAVMMGKDCGAIRKALVGNYLITAEYTDPECEDRQRDEKSFTSIEIRLAGEKEICEFNNMF